MPIEAAHILSGTVSLDGRKVLNGPYELSWADKYLGLSRWEQLSTDDAAIVNQLLDDVGNANIASKIAWQESLTREQAETVRIAKARHAKIVNEVINEGGEGYGSPVAPHNDNTPEMKGDDQPE